jgi:hypothetical protein
MSDPYNSKNNYREKTISLKGDYCHICATRDGIEAHHIDRTGPGSKTGKQNDHVHNLLPVCSECHGKIHSADPDGDSVYSQWAEYATRHETPAECSPHQYIEKHGSLGDLRYGELDTEWERRIHEHGREIGRELADIEPDCETVLDALPPHGDSIDTREVEDRIGVPRDFDSKQFYRVLWWLDEQRIVKYESRENTVRRVFGDSP